MGSIDMDQIIEATTILREFPNDHAEEVNAGELHDDAKIITMEHFSADDDIETGNYMRAASHNIECVVTWLQNDHPHNSNSLVTQSNFPHPPPTRGICFGPMGYGGHILNSRPNRNVYIHVVLPPPIGESHQHFMANHINGEELFQTLDKRSDCGSIHETSNSLSCDARYCLNAPEGRKHEVHKEVEDTFLPKDEKWPFLLRFPIGFFGICLGLGSQTILWKTLSMVPSFHLLVPIAEVVNLTFWCLALVTFITIFMIYSAKCVFYFRAVQREFYHPIRINFFFAPWIACMFLVLGVPPILSKAVHSRLLVLLMAPILTLEIKIYGQWLSGSKRKLCKVANPSTHLSLVGNFVGALFAAELQLKELAIFFWAIGLAHYLVLFVTLYQRLPTATVIPKKLHPVYFLFIAAPSTASVAWSRIVGDFDFVSRISYFVGLFLFSSLMVRVNLFCGFRFNIAWWAYTFPMTASAIASTHYSLKINHPFTQGLALLLSSISLFLVFTFSILTILHVFLWCTLFPNDIDIATTRNRMIENKVKGSQKNAFTTKLSLPSPLFLRNGSSTGQIGSRSTLK